MNFTQKCCQCLQIFKLSNPPRILPSCQHNICTKCLKQVIQQRQQFIECQFCFNKTRKKQIKLFQKNMKLLTQIKNQSINSSESISNNHQLTQMSISKIDDDFQENIFKNQELLIPEMEDQKQTKNKQFCFLHNKALDIICITQKIRICPHCAIFGNHKDHRFKTIIQFQQQLKQKDEQFNKILLAKQVQNLATQKIQKIHSYSDIKAQIVSKIQKRKQYLSQELNTNFQNLIKQIKTAQCLIKEELDQKFQKAKEKINQTLIDQKKIKSKFQTWEQSCNKVIQKLSKAKDINQKANVFYESPLQICKEGEIYLQEIQKSFEKIIQTISDQINSISIKILDINLKNYANLIFPILSEKEIKSSGSKNSVQLPTESFIQNQSQNELNDNSFIQESQFSRILQKKQSQNKTAKKTYNKKNQHSFLGNISQVSMFLPQQSLKTKIQFQKQQHQNKSTLNRVKSNPRIFKSPDSRLQKNKSKKNITQAMDSFVKNDLTNQLDLSQYHLNNQELFDYIEKASRIRPIKSLKIQGNKLTDSWFQKMIELLPSVSNINLSYNMLTSKILQILNKHLQELKNLKIVNLKHNKILINKTQRKWNSILDQFKKQRIMITID